MVVEIVRIFRQVGGKIPATLLETHPLLIEIHALKITL